MSRLIDSDDVKDLLNGLDSLPWEEEVDDLVNGLSTVDAVPVVHGTYTESEENEEWYGKVYKCEMCGTECMVSDIKDFAVPPKICPICSARFDGKEE